MAKLYFYYSAMNAGKTTTLLQSNFNYLERGMHTLVFTPAIDTRYGVGKVASRIGLQADAIPFDAKFNFLIYVQKQQHVIKPNCIFVDEAQFLNKCHVEQLADIVDILNIPILTYGLRTDYLGELFEGSQYLLAWADEIVEIKTICHCGSKATMNIRKTPPTTLESTIDIGGHNEYASTCRKHYKHNDTGPLLTIEEIEAKSNFFKDNI